MEPCTNLNQFLRRLISLTLIGAAVLLFAGPILTILVMIAVCATVGFLVWLPVHTALFGKHSILRAAREHGERCRQQLQVGFGAVNQCWRPLAQRIQDTACHWASAVGDAVLEIACGSFVAVLMAFAAGVREQGLGVAALLGACIGVVVVIGASRASHAPQQHIPASSEAQSAHGVG